MMCTTVLHGGVRHHTSTPHRSGNMMKGKQKKGPSRSVAIFPQMTMANDRLQQNYLVDKQAIMATMTICVPRCFC